MKRFVLSALLVAVAMGFIAQDRYAYAGPSAPLSLFEVLVFDSLPDLQKTQEI